MLQLNAITILLIGAGYVTGLLTGWMFARIFRPKTTAKAKDGDVVLGLRFSSHRARLREGVHPVRGRYTWSEKGKGSDGNFEADVYLDGDFGYPLGDGRTLHIVDLDSYHVVDYQGPTTEEAAVRGLDPQQPLGPRKVLSQVQFEGKAQNDDDETLVMARDGRQLGTIHGVWRRLPGTRLLKIRKDLRIAQLNDIMQPWWTAMMKFVPFAIVGLGLLVVASLFLLLKLVNRH